MKHTENSELPKQSPSPLQAKVIRAADVSRVYGLKRSFLYELIKQKRVSSIVISGRNKSRGIRLFYAEEIEQIIRTNTVPPEL